MKSSSFAPVRVSITLSGLMSRWTRPLSFSSQPLAGFGFRQVAFAAFGIQLLEARRIGVEGDERVEQVERDVYRLPVAKASLPVDELVERLAVDELGDEIPVAGVGLAGPEDLHHVGMMDLPQGADLAAHRRVSGRRCRRA